MCMLRLPLRILVVFVPLCRGTRHYFKICGKGERTFRLIQEGVKNPILINYIVRYVKNKKKHT